MTCTIVGPRAVHRYVLRTLLRVITSRDRARSQRCDARPSSRSAMFCHSQNLTGRRSHSEEEVKSIPDSLSHALLGTRRLLLTVFLAMVAWLLLSVVAERASADPGAPQAEPPGSAATNAEASPPVADDGAPARSPVGGPSTETGDDAAQGVPGTGPQLVTDTPDDGNDPPQSEQPAPQVEPVPDAQSESSPEPVSGPATPADSGDAAPTAPVATSTPPPTTPSLASAPPAQPGSPVAPALPLSAPLRAESVPLAIAEPAPAAPADTVSPPPEVPKGTSTGADALAEALSQVTATAPPVPTVDSLAVGGVATRGLAARSADTGVCRPAVVADSARTATADRPSPPVELPSPFVTSSDSGQNAPVAPPVHPAPSPVAPTAPSGPCASAFGGSIAAGGGHGSHHDVILAVGASGSGVAATQAEVRRMQRAADKTRDRSRGMEPPPD